MDNEAALHEIAARINNRIAAGCQMSVGKTMRHPSGRTVKIKSGQFLSNGRVSNFWCWNEIKPDGTIGPDEHGYGW
jgi:hypothetical protein